MSAGTHLIRTRHEAVAVRWTTRGAVTLAVAALIGGLASLAAIYSGNRDISAEVVTQILVGDYRQATAFEVYTVLENRVPRAICALLAGALFAVAGTVFQRLTENPLGSPDLIGFSNGASAGALAAIAFGGLGLSIVAGALMGGLLAVAAVYLLAWRRGVEGYRLLIVGIAVGAVLSAVSSYLLSRIDLSDAMAGYRWLIGGLAGRGWADAALGAAGIVVIVPFALVLHRSLDRLSVGADMACSQGLDVRRAQGLAALVGTGCVAVAVCLAGPVGFIALASPHIARMVSRRPGPLMATSAAVGAALLAVADLLATRLFPPHQIPAGVVTAVVGGLYVVWLLQHRIRRESSV